jgi:hypothetical protein
MTQDLLFDLRYRFDYFDGKPSKIGKWNHSGNHIANQAWSVDTKNLSWAFIEAKKIETGEIKKIVECPGQDFRFFQWRAIRSVHLKNVSAPSATINIGLVMWTRTKKIFSYRYGVVEIEDLSDWDSNHNFAAYGR